MNKYHVADENKASESITLIVKSHACYVL